MSTTSRRTPSRFLQDVFRGLTRSGESFRSPVDAAPRLPKNLIGTASGSKRLEIDVKPSFWSDFLGGLTKTGSAFRNGPT